LLYNGEAIFGVVDFVENPQAAAQRAARIAERAGSLGGIVQVTSFGCASLGFVQCKETEPVPEIPFERQSISAVSCGELIDRRGAGTQYRSATDRCEFLVNGVGLFGEKLLEYIDGTFVAAIWNSSLEQLILACDSRADCHLYYVVENHQLVFSSWLTLITSRSQEIERDAVSEFLRFLYVAAPRTIYKGVLRLEGQRYLIATRAKVETRRLLTNQARNDVAVNCQDSNQIQSRFEYLFEQAIHRRIDNRRVGVLLSSGVDSATLMAGCHKATPGQVEAFTVGFDNAENDETNAARALAAQIGVPHTSLHLGFSQYQMAFHRVASGFEQPFGDPAGLALLLACDAAKENFEVLCDGTGSDGLFGAPMPRHLKFSLMASAKLPKQIRKELKNGFRMLGGRHLARYASLFDFSDPEELFITWAGWRRCELSELLGTPVNFEESGFYKLFRASRKLGAQKLYDEIGVLPPDDSRFEAAGLAMVRMELPYHDIDLWTFVRSVPEEFRIAGDQTKVLLKRLYARYFGAGAAIAKKKYFNVPVSGIMSSSNFAIVKQYLAPENMRRHGLVDPKKAWPWIDRYVAGAEDLRFKVWALLVLHAWLEARN
jgi:asparagine synthase (glutamine-hydrolysing)